MTELVVSHSSYLLLILVLALTGAGLPIPEEVLVITAGIMASHGQWNPWLAFAACLLGALAGDCVMYAIGYYFGRNVVREHRYWARLVTPQREAQVEEKIARHGLKVLFLARFLVVFRSPVYLAAGILRLPFRRFFVFDLFCATAVIGTFFLLSYHYGQTITQWIRSAEILVTVVVVVVVLTAGLHLWRLHRQRVAPVASQPDGDESAAFAGSEEERASDVEHLEHVA